MRWPSRYLASILVVSALAIPAIVAKEAANAPDETFLQANTGWSERNGNPGQTQFSSLAQINTTNVKTLGAAWISKKFAEGATSRSTPIVSNGIMFLNAGRSVYALNSKTGDVVWTYEGDPFTGVLTGGPSSGSGTGVPNGQGPAVGGGFVYVALMNCQVIALDEKTGTKVWAHDLKAYFPRKGQSIAAAPVYVNGVIFTSLTQQERYVGRVMALDAKDGHELWHFDIIPGPGEPGHETWATDNEAWKMGGGNVWLPPAVDPDLGLVYYGTGNADVIHGGDLRPGNNLFTCSVIALDVKTGKMRWYYQLTHHDLWEHDLGTPLILYDLEMGGRMRKGLAALHKDGYLFLLDRETGKPLLPIYERPVAQDARIHTAPTQPFPEGDSIIEDCPTYWKGKLPTGFVLGCLFTPPTLSVPNMLQPEIGAIFEPISFSPQTGYIYVQARTSLMSNRRAEDPYYQDMNSFGLLTSRAPGVHKYDRYELAAIDARTNKIVWKKIEPRVSNFGTGGWLTTAGGLAFHRMLDGNLKAFDAKTGDQVWQFQTGVTSGDATPMSYEYEGKQYISIVEGTAVWSFALNGSIPPAPDPPPPAPTPDVAGPIRNTDTIHSASLLPDFNGTRWRVDEWAFDPYRARVSVGTPVTFLNNGDSKRTIVGVDGSWTTGTLDPNDQATVTFDKAGEYLYHPKEYPWSYGQVIVVTGPLLEAAPGGPNAGGPPPAAAAGSPGNAGPAARSLAARSVRGQVGYAQTCSACHGAELAGNGETVPGLVGEGFIGRWQGRTADDLFQKTRSTMPPANPRSLSDEAYLDIMAYILQANQLSVEREITVDSVKEITVKK